MDAGLKILHREVFPAGSIIFKEGSVGSHAYVIESGKMAIWREVNGERRTLGIVAEGSIFGEMALIDNQPRMASASAADPFLVGLLRIFMRNIRSLTDTASEQ